MASLVAKLWARFCTKRAPLSIMIIGLDNSGKTSILNYLSSLNYQRGSNQQLSAKAQEKSQEVKRSASPSEEQSTSRAPFESCDSISANKKSGAHHNQDVGAQTLRVSGHAAPTVGYNYERIHYRGITLTVLDFSGQNRYRNLWQEFYNSVDGIVFVVDSSDLIRLVVVRDELETMLNHPYFGTLLDERLLTSAASSRQEAEFDSKSDAPLACVSKALLSAAVNSQKQITISQGKLVQSPLDTAALLPSQLANKGSLLGANSAKCAKTLPGKSSLRRRTKVPILFLANKSDLANSMETSAIVRALNLSQLPIERHPWLIQATSVHLSQGVVEGFDWLLAELTVSATS